MLVLGLMVPISFEQHSRFIVVSVALRIVGVVGITVVMVIISVVLIVVVGVGLMMAVAVIVVVTRHDYGLEQKSTV
jgi:hypothetical protein